MNVLPPPDALSGTVPVQVTVNGVPGAAFSVPAQTAAPTPAKPGETVVLYGNGFGETSPPVAAGSASPSGTLLPTPVIRIGGAVAEVKFAGLVSPGLFQFNVTVPSAITDGDQPVTATYSGLSTQPGLVISVKR